MSKLDLTIITTGVLAVFTYLFGAFDILIQGAFMFIVLDFITGLAKAWHNGEVSSAKSWKGLLKKTMFLSMILIGHWLDKVSLIPDSSMSFRTLVLVFVITNEAISILENISEMGVPIPGILKKILERLDKREDEEPD
ncbi:holin family protein [Sebaldella sp. S0638]|uniref:phage holin family protein n=1 Tax=Sebaldella sp. S0638 TaxID=2957809 RepID=UPI00209D66FF|nr:phage holin family protein [Sebaldella sp. S0638]MCP1226568.1 phage holin family protein [Sebaldella sp. S0638]